MGTHRVKSLAGQAPGLQGLVEAVGALLAVLIDYALLPGEDETRSLLTEQAVCALPVPSAPPLSSPAFLVTPSSHSFSG